MNDLVETHIKIKILLIYITFFFFLSSVVTIKINIYLNKKIIAKRQHIQVELDKLTRTISNTFIFSRNHATDARTC